MSFTPQEARAQLRLVYEQMIVEGRPGYEKVAFGENTFNDLLTFLAMTPDGDRTELIYRLSEGVDTVRVAALYNVLMWSAENNAGVDPEVLQEWFYRRERRRVEIALQADIYPSNSMEESQRILDEIKKRFPPLRGYVRRLRQEVDHRLAEEEAWSQYRRETFEMPKEMTPSIMGIIENIKRRQ
ncbi:hypothetical protein [Lewinella sp. W8]|uniref:hypothetical protein n=1 Tax=Lewinella sp. W8 TaxID=2528208 RepID=UPI0010681AF9|nr:hypothetical protein [Lewinella sp. W8]MTB50673.1 hypothetical protein [Lewinella sp. W8]